MAGLSSDYAIGSLEIHNNNFRRKLLKCDRLWTTLILYNLNYSIESDRYLKSGIWTTPYCRLRCCNIAPKKHTNLHNQIVIQLQFFIRHPKIINFWIPSYCCIRYIIPSYCCIRYIKVYTFLLLLLDLYLRDIFPIKKVNLVPFHDVWWILIILVDLHRTKT